MYTTYITHIYTNNLTYPIPTVHFYKHKTANTTVVTTSLFQMLKIKIFFEDLLLYIKSVAPVTVR